MSNATATATAWPDLIEALAHELRHDVSAVLHQCELLRVDGLGENVRRRSLNAIETNAEGLLRFTDDLSELGRMLRGDVAPKLRSIDIAELIGETVGDRETPLHWSQPNVSEYEMCTVEADPVLVRVIVTGILEACTESSDRMDPDVVTASAQQAGEFVDVVFARAPIAVPIDAPYRDVTIKDGLSMLLVSTSARLIGGTVATCGTGGAKAFRLRLSKSDSNAVSSTVTD